jgi:hypothetical protein
VGRTGKVDFDVKAEAGGDEELTEPKPAVSDDVDRADEGGIVIAVPEWLVPPKTRADGVDPVQPATSNAVATRSTAAVT